MKIHQYLLLLLVAMLLTSCATIFSGKTQKINITSNKPVEVEIDDKLYKVPNVIEVRRENKDKVIKVLNDKCEPKKVLLNKQLNSFFLINLFSAGVFGSTTDYATDAMWKYQDNVNIHCEE